MPTSATTPTTPRLPSASTTSPKRARATDPDSPRKRLKTSHRTEHDTSQAPTTSSRPRRPIKVPVETVIEFPKPSTKLELVIPTLDPVKMGGDMVLRKYRQPPRGKRKRNLDEEDYVPEEDIERAPAKRKKVASTSAAPPQPIKPKQPTKPSVRGGLRAARTLLQEAFMEQADSELVSQYHETIPPPVNGSWHYTPDAADQPMRTSISNDTDGLWPPTVSAGPKDVRPAFVPYDRTVPVPKLSTDDVFVVRAIVKELMCVAPEAPSSVEEYDEEFEDFAQSLVNSEVFWRRKVRPFVRNVLIRAEAHVLQSQRPGIHSQHSRITQNWPQGLKKVSMVRFAWQLITDVKLPTCRSTSSRTRCARSWRKLSTRCVLLPKAARD